VIVLFLHLGADVVVSLRDVVAILDVRTRETSRATDEYLQLAGSERRAVDISGGNPKSFVVTTTGVMYSPISSLTLRKRAELARLGVTEIF